MGFFIEMSHYLSHFISLSLKANTGAQYSEYKTNCLLGGYKSIFTAQIT